MWVICPRFRRDEKLFPKETASPASYLRPKWTAAATRLGKFWAPCWSGRRKTASRKNLFMAAMSSAKTRISSFGRQTLHHCYAVRHHRHRGVRRFQGLESAQSKDRGTGRLTTPPAQTPPRNTGAHTSPAWPAGLRGRPPEAASWRSAIFGKKRSSTPASENPAPATAT